MAYAVEYPLSDAGSNDDLTVEFLGAAQLDRYAALTGDDLRHLVTSVQNTI